MAASSGSSILYSSHPHLLPDGLLKVPVHIQKSICCAFVNESSVLCQ